MAGEDRTAAWIDGRIADSWPRLARPRHVLMALALLVALADAVLAVGLREAETDDAQALSATDARKILAEAAADPGAWLLLGDSVLAGDAMAGRVPGWQHHRVLDYLRSEQAPSTDEAAADGVRFRQVALDGLLPADVDRLVAELDRHDPRGKVPLVIELNLRHFSRHYADEAGCTRSWLCELGGADASRQDITKLAISPLAWVAAELRPWLPVLRHKRSVDLDSSLAGFGERLAVARSGEALQSRADEGAARIAEHYRDSALEGESTQVQALDRVLARLRARGRKAVFFTTPLRDTFVAEVASEAEIGGRYAALAERIHDSRAPATLVQLDHPLFVPELFLDHCHLGPDGNRLLALNLLQALDVPLASRPGPLEMIRAEGPHETLVGRVDTGYAEGASWQALFDHPRGLAVRAKPREIVVADTGNHVLRRLRGSLETTELLAGTPGEAGSVDGPGPEARLDGPQQPCFLGDSVYFLDGPQRRLRVLEGGKVRTIDSPRTRDAAALRCHNKRVWLLVGRELRAYDPGDGKIASYTFAGEAQSSIGRTFTIARDGRIFVVSKSNQIFSGRRPKEGNRLSLERVFANSGAGLLPKERKKRFPFAFDDIRFDEIVDIAFVERYGGLLVQVVEAPRVPVVGLTENVHLRYLELRQRKIFPWIKPEVYGQSYLMYNDSSESLVSGYHQGSMALDQASASLFYVEHARSRLYRVDDGLLGAAKVSHFGGNAAKLKQPDRFGGKMAGLVQARMHPHKHIAARWQRKPRRGPYLGLILGSSKSAYHDILGEYSIGRRIEHELVSELGYRDRVGFDLYQRTSPGASLAKMVQTIAESEEQGLPFDVAFLEVYSLADRFLQDTLTEAEQLARLAELDAIRRDTGMLIVFLDTTSLGSRRRDAMRAAPREAVEFIALAERLGFPVLRPSDRLIREHLDHSAWSNQPWSRKRRQHHGSTWGIDLTGEMLASMAYPMVAAYTRAAAPRHARDDAGSGRRKAGPEAEARLLAGVLTGRAIKASALPAIDREMVQVRYDKGHLRLFVDRGKPGAQGDAEGVVLAALHAFLVDDVYGALVERVTIDLARFRSYNEYGVGVLDAAELEARYEFEREALDTFVAEALTRHPEWGR
ncbi:hypothetical protein [Nannocystis punicea]|uniref:Uncharacterized protein n=1 Tax=Nannocystis punicea TaxID=2995304 RepID=A0ABY7H8G0_9BACT|nr:hypothetical protein [Nannocystis poenicansa]WAS95274.1 hypothetical protein O0S08_03870 [Nannocystis poenicansa]